MDLTGLSDLLTPAVLFLIFLAILVCCRSRREKTTVKGKMIGEKHQERVAPSPDLDDEQLKDLQENLERYIDIKLSQFKKEILGIIERTMQKPPHPPEIEPDQTTGTKDMEPMPDHSIDEVEVEPDPGLSRVVSSCVAIYNEAIDNPEDERRFRKEYRPERIDIPNAMERLRDPDLEPLFVSADNGDLFVVELKDEDSTSYAVFPRFGLTISSANYYAGAMGVVFNCPGFKLQYNYKIKGVVRPAFFQRGRGSRWELSKPGELLIFSEEYGDG